MYTTKTVQNVRCVIGVWERCKRMKQKQYFKRK